MAEDTISINITHDFLDGQPLVTLIGTSASSASALSSPSGVRRAAAVLPRPQSRASAKRWPGIVGNAGARSPVQRHCAFVAPHTPDRDRFDSTTIQSWRCPEMIQSE